MAWLFPAEQIIEDADFTSTGSPLSIVNEAVMALLAADVPHHYSLLGLANEYHPAWQDRDDGQPRFRVHPFFNDPLSDQIPSERGHEVWNRRSPFRRADYQTYREILRRAVRVRLDALMAITERLTDDLRGTLTAVAPTARTVLDQTRPLGGVSRDSEILYQHARLMAAAQKLEIDLLMATPPHQREAKFASVRLEALLQGRERREALEALGRQALIDDHQVFVFRMSERSVQAKIEPGDFTWSLLPESALEHQHASIARLKRLFPNLERVSGPAQGRDFRQRLREACQVDVVIFDRASRLVVVRPTTFSELPSLIQAGVLDFAIDGRAGRFAILDPLALDFFVNLRLKPALRAIRVPPLSRARPLFRNLHLTRLRIPNPRQTDAVPAERFIWGADYLAEEVSRRDVEVAVRAIAGENCTPRQLEAVRRAVERRLALLWGPPGTGKSRTAVALITALIAEAEERGVQLKLAITGPTWVAIDTVARRLPEVIERMGLTERVQLARLASRPAGAPAVDEALIDYLVPTDGGRAHAALIERLEDGEESTIVAGTAHQLAKLFSGDEAMESLFDFMIIDEASQMSVAEAVVAFTTLAEDASLTVVGDDLQMPPIQQVAPPVGAEHLVGSIYDFYRRYREGEDDARQVHPVMLDRSFRSNTEIVEFVRLAGYGEELTAVTRDFVCGSTPPSGGAPAGLAGGSSLARTHRRDLGAGRAAGGGHPPGSVFELERNDAEADLVAGLVRALYGRLLREGAEEPLDGRCFRRGLGSSRHTEHSRLR